MSLPKTDEEVAQFYQSKQAAGPGENVVSTACPACQVRFAVVAKFTRAGWHLRCTRCSRNGKGELKT